MTYDFKSLKKETDETIGWLKREHSGIRTSSATPALLDGVTVLAYGSQTPLNQTASISVEDARTLRITPWDKELVKEIEKAITNANFGVSISTDESGSRVSFPELTSERREQLVKLMKDKLEDARIALKSARDKVWNDIQKKEKSKEISEDEKFSYKDEMQKIIDDGNKTLDELSEKKEKEIRS